MDSLQSSTTATRPLYGLQVTEPRHKITRANLQLQHRRTIWIWVLKWHRLISSEQSCDKLKNNKEREEKKKNTMDK